MSRHASRIFHAIGDAARSRFKDRYEVLLRPVSWAGHDFRIPQAMAIYVASTDAAPRVSGKPLNTVIGLDLFAKQPIGADRPEVDAALQGQMLEDLEALGMLCGRVKPDGVASVSIVPRGNGQFSVDTYFDPNLAVAGAITLVTLEWVAEDQ